MINNFVNNFLLTQTLSQRLRKSNKKTKLTKKPARAVQQGEHHPYCQGRQAGMKVLCNSLHVLCYLRVQSATYSHLHSNVSPSQGGKQTPSGESSQVGKSSFSQASLRPAISKKSEVPLEVYEYFYKHHLAKFSQLHSLCCSSTVNANKVFSMEIHLSFSFSTAS